MSLRRLALVAAAGAAWACAPHPAWVAYAPPPSPTPEQIVADLSRLRGLPLDAPLDVAFVDEASFLRAYHDSVQTTGKAHKTAYYGAFGLSGADVDAMAHKMIDRELLGFYEPHAKRLYVRRKGGGAAPTPMELFTLAHEAEHALQDRFFGTSAFENFDDIDQSLAWRSLTEGDAVLASSVLDAAQHGFGPSESVVRISEVSRAQEGTWVSAALTGRTMPAPSLLRAQLAWPYARGLSFVGALAESGGWALVNAALRNPPKTTEQVLHIEKYLAGEGAVDVGTPPPVDGYALVERGRMGELQTRYVLAECMADPQANRAAKGWGGDAYSIVARGGDQALLWSTAWDDEAAATRFADALEARRSCSRTGPKPPFTVARSGVRVAFVQGLDSEDARVAEARQLLSLVGNTPPSLPPLGPVALRLESPVTDYFSDPTARPGEDLVRLSLDMESDLRGLTPTGKEPGGAFIATGEQVAVAAWVEWGPPSAALNDATTAILVDRLRKQFGTAKVLDGGTRQVRLRWTDAEERAIKVGDLSESRLAFAPTCAGRMTVVLMTSWKAATFGENRAAAWRASVTAGATQGACRAMKELRDPRAAP